MFGKSWRWQVLLAIITGILTIAAIAQTGEQRASQHLDSVRLQPSLLLDFLRGDAKGR